jgi:dTDP-4-amino-4,6-dideoxygalactose transaminase
MTNGSSFVIRHSDFVIRNRRIPMSWKVKFINYPLHFRNMETEIMGVIHEVLSGGDLILRKQTESFEANFAAFCGAKYAVGVSNCTDALHLAYRAAGIGPGDEVITVSHTFVATVAGIVHAGATPVLVDIGDDHLMDPDKLEAAITPRTKAVVPVSLNGRPCDLRRIREIADRRGLLVIEDSAQALGGSIAGKKAGCWGLAGCFSFYPAKLLGAFGDAGAVITDDPAIAEKVRLLRNHGRTPDNDLAGWSFNCRIDNLHAALLDLKLKRLPAWIDRRRAIARLYAEELSGVPQLRLPPGADDEADRRDVFQNYELEAEERDGLLRHLREQGVETLLPWGGKAVHQFRALGLGQFKLPKTEEVFGKVLMLPMYPELTDDEVRYVADVVKRFYGRPL